MVYPEFRDLLLEPSTSIMQRFYREPSNDFQYRVRFTSYKWSHKTVYSFLFISFQLSLPVHVTYVKYFHLLFLHVHSSLGDVDSSSHYRQEISGPGYYPLHRYLDRKDYYHPYYARPYYCLRRTTLVNNVTPDSNSTFDCRVYYQ